METKKYHILSLSGGKDSTALAFFMKENMPEIFEKLKLVFCDTECDLPETYDY
jgi:3'-phosphoadenosine 5'-phosphosulfate sulfotransferase (PAPS reductase)/FAD synthetase